VKDRVVIKLSGSVFTSASRGSMQRYAKMLREISRKVQPIAVAGGGKSARYYIDLARQLGADESSLDQIGIEISRLNAMMLVFALGEKAYPCVPANLEEVSKAAETGKVVVTGGLHPGQSTNATSALIAERVSAKSFINATDVDGIYDSDPRKNRQAKMMKKVGVRELLRLLSSGSTVAGAYDLMDIVALKVIERSKIPTRVVKADIATIKKAVAGSAVGTEITLT
jgi:uridylate kinase